MSPLYSGGLWLPVKTIPAAAPRSATADASTGDRYELTELNLVSGRIAAGEAVPLDGGLAFRLEPAGLSGRIDIGLVVAFDADAATVSISDLDVDGRVEGVAEVPATIRVRAPSIQLQTGAQNADLGEIGLQFMSVDLVADAWLGDHAVGERGRVAGTFGDHERHGICGGAGWRRQKRDRVSTSGCFTATLVYLRKSSTVCSGASKFDEDCGDIVFAAVEIGLINQHESRFESILV